MCPARHPLAADALQVRIFQRGFGQAFQRVIHDLQGLLLIHIRFQLGTKQGVAWVVAFGIKAEYAGSQVLVNQILVQLSAGGVAQGADAQAQVHVFRAGSAGQVVQRHDQGRTTVTAQGNCAGTVLHGFNRVFGAQRASRFWYGAKGLGNVLQSLIGVELPGHKQHRIIGLIVVVVELAQLFNIHVFDVGAGANRGLAVAMPLVRSGCQLLHQNTERAVFTAFHFIAHHGHFRFQILLVDQSVDHHVGLPVQIPFQGLGISGEAGKVIGTVAGGGAVGFQATFGKFSQRIAQGGGAAKQHMLQKVSHAGLPIVLVPRADQVGHVDGGRRFGIVWGQNKAQAIVQRVLSDAFDRGALGQTCG